MIHIWNTREAGRVISPRLTARRRPLRRIAFVLTVLAILGVGGAAAALYAQGYRVWIVHTGSMEPTYMPGDIVIDSPPSGHYHAGEVLTFRHSDLTTDVVTHRVTDITPSGLIHTKGDANRTADVWDIRPNQVQGQVTFKLKYVGYVLVFLQQPTGIGVIATVIVALVLLWQLFFPAAPTAAGQGETPEPLAGDRELSEVSSE